MATPDPTFGQPMPAQGPTPSSYAQGQPPSYTQGSTPPSYMQAQPPMVPQMQQYPYPAPYMMPYASYQVVDRIEKQVNQLPLVALLLSIFAWPLILTASKTNDWDFFATVVAIPAVVMAHLALARRPDVNKSSGYGLAIGALISGYFLLSVSFAWAILRYF